MQLITRPLTPDLWPAFEDLFGDNGACGGCWCMYWRIGSAYQKRPRTQNKLEFQQIVHQGPPPGLLAFEGQRAVGWCQLTERSALPRLEHSRWLRSIDDLPVWSLSCFYVRKGYRRRGVTSALIAEAVRIARRAGAPALEAYPMDRAETMSTGSLYTGKASTFRRAGFKTVARRVPHRPMMRLALR